MDGGPHPRTLARAVGAQIACRIRLLSFGMAYDSSAVEDEDRTADVPMGEAWRFSVAAAQVEEELDLGLAPLSSGQRHGPRPARAGGRLAGSYEDTSLHYIATNLRWRF
jgi:long-chain fatty acid transport protein